MADHRSDLLLAYGKAAGLDTCFSPVTAYHGALRVGQYQRFRLGVNQAKSVNTAYPEGRGAPDEVQKRLRPTACVCRG